MAETKGRDFYVEQLKLMAQTIIDRADELIGDISLVRSYEFDFGIYPGVVPEITFKKNFFPREVTNGNSGQ